MAVMAREAWTDERLDDLKENVNQRFDEVDKRFDQVDKRFDRVEADIRELRSDMKRGFERIDGEMKAGFAEVNARFDAMQRTMIIGFVSMIGSVVVSVLGGILVTQL